MKKLAALLLALALLLSLAACGGNNGSADLEENGTQNTQDPQDTVPEPEPEPEPEPYDIYDPTVMPEGGSRDGVTYVAYDGIV